MKEIIVTSKRDFPIWVDKVKSFENQPWAYISIEGTDDLAKTGIIGDNTHFLEDGPDILNLNFDDVEEDIEYTSPEGVVYKAKAITEFQARKILDFAKNHKDYNLLIHCMAGKSRSVAIGEGLIEIFPEVWKRSPRSNPFLTPNMKVLALLKRLEFHRFA